MTTQLDFEKNKKGTDNSDVKAEASPVLLQPTLDKEPAHDLTDVQLFCSLCGCYHKPNAKLRCALNRAITEIVSPAHRK